MGLPAGDTIVEFPEASNRPAVSVGALPAPDKGKVVLALGDTQDLTVKRTLLAQRKAALEFDKLGKLTGYDLIEDYRLEVANYTAAAVKVRLWEIVMAQWELKSDPPPVKTEGGRAAFELQPAAGATATLTFTLTKHTGTRADRLS